jgi:starch phosphorylase
VELELEASAKSAGDYNSPTSGKGLNPADVAALQAAILQKLTYHVGKRRSVATDRDWLIATAVAVRDRIVDRWVAGTEAAYKAGSKRVYYLSLEFLVGRLLFDNLNNMNMIETMRAALAGLDVDLDKLRALEPDAALGNGGLGRLAACFMESMATLDIPAYGYGIRYEHGLFRQVMKNGWQHEYPEDWLALGNPWEFHRPEVRYPIGFGGAIEAVPVSEAAVRHIWHPAETIEAVAYDTPAVGWRGRRVNTLRLWSAQSADPLRLDAFNHGDHAGALAAQVRAESISKVLYPSDATPAGQELRLRDCLPAELLGQPGGGGDPGGGFVGADLHRRDGSLRHRQHEDGAEWRADDRHHGRRQCGNP